MILEVLMILEIRTFIRDVKINIVFVSYKYLLVTSFYMYVLFINSICYSVLLVYKLFLTCFKFTEKHVKKKSLCSRRISKESKESQAQITQMLVLDRFSICLYFTYDMNLQGHVSTHVMQSGGHGDFIYVLYMCLFTVCMYLFKY